jgi:hypothetical protein
MLGKILNTVGGVLGIGGSGQGEHYQAPTLESKGQRALGEEIDAYNSANVKALIDQLQRGEISLSEAVARTSSPAELAALASSPVGGSLVASQQVRTDPLSSGMFGDDGSLERAIAEERELAERGYSLQPEDYEAYGQASGDIARMFGQSEQSLAQALADRGLATADSGVARSEFSGLYGNKNEQLAGLQRQIANDRMEKNLQRLAQTRDFTARLGALGQDALNSAYSRNLSGAQQRTNTFAQAADADIGKYNAEQGAMQAAMESKLANKEMGLGDALTKGIFSGVQGAASGIIGAGGNKVATGMFGPQKKPTQKKPVA